MADMNFQPIFDYIDQNSQKLKQDIMIEVRGELSGMKISLANLSADVKGLREEMAVANHRVKRFEDWAEPVGKHLGMPIAL